MTTLKSLSNKDYIWPLSKKKKKDSSMSVHGLIAHFFSVLKNIPLFRYTTVYLQSKTFYNQDYIPAVIHSRGGGV